MTESRQMGEAGLDRVGEIEIDVTDSRRVARAPDQHEWAALCLKSLDAGIVQERLHQDDAVGAPTRHKLRDRPWVGGGRGEKQRVVAGARRLRRSGHEGLLQRQQLPLRPREEQSDRVRCAARESAGGTVRAVVELLDRCQNALPHLPRDGPLAAQDV